MNLLLDILYLLLPLIGAGFLFIGVKKGHINHLFAALWLSLIALLLHYRHSGGELLGTYFGYKNAAIYTFNLLILLLTTLSLFFKFPLRHGKLTRYATGVIAAGLIVAFSILLVNLWLNAYFIENRRSGTPILQVTRFTPLDYCNYRYVFYKVNTNNKISYMCPNHYGVVASLGTLDTWPEFVLNHLSKVLHEPKR